MKTKDTVISFVVPCHNEEQNVEILHARLLQVLDGMSFEIIFVDDGSRDDTLTEIKALAAKDAAVKYISFSRNFGHQAALRAGLGVAKGAAVISMDADLQHPPELVPELIDAWKDGYDVVYTIRRDDASTGLFKRMTSKVFYRALNFLSGLHIEDGAADFRLIDHRVVMLINEQQETDIFLRGYINWLGFKQKGIPYAPAERANGVSKYSLTKMFALGAQGVTQFSVKPLRLAFLLSVGAFTLSILYVFYAVWVAVLGGGTVPGWLSLVVLFVFLQGVQFLLLGLIGEYLGRAFMQTKHRPEFIVRETNCV